MNFTNLSIKKEYRSFRHDIVREFYIPLLNMSTKYQRAVGFFSSSALIEISEGITGLIKNGGTVELIASPKLSEQDVEAIGKGISIRDEIIEKRITESITPPQNYYEEERLNLLVNLIAKGILEIKIAVVENKNSIGMFHEKLGLLYDNDGNIVAFSGSMNESTNAFMHNYESIDVFKSWGYDEERVEIKKSAFEAMWGDSEPNIKVLKFPEASEKKLLTYRKNDYIYTDIDEEQFGLVMEKDINEKEGPKIPKSVELRDYQRDAIVEWEKRGFVGIFDMATGTGKTFTGLAAIVQLYETVSDGLAVFIVCPYLHLVSQWEEDAKMFGLNPIICHSSSKQRNWKSRLNDGCLSLNLGLTDHFCAIFTNATYSSSYVQEVIEPVLQKSVLVVDEAHNFGAQHLSKFLKPEIKYRLALSATIERFGDDEGTEKLYDFFGDKCIEYTLEEAIQSDMLTKYFYYPIVVSFEDDELEEYIEISRRIARSVFINDSGDLSEHTKMLLIKRARMVAASRQKVYALCEEMKNHKDDSHMLVYCGATTIKDVGFDEETSNDEEKKQIDIITNQLGNELNMKVAKFTAEENLEEREVIKREFEEGVSLQALIAIRCLDEGVNIPSIRKAFILASSTNPKQYIQRRGRVLRRFKDKDYAEIYDFIMSPLSLGAVDSYDEETVRLTRSLVKKEITRMLDFVNLAENPSVADSLISQLIKEYDINLNEEDDDIV